MKTQLFRVWALGVAVGTIALGSGCQAEKAQAEVPDLDQIVPEIVVADTSDAAKGELPAAPVDLVAAPDLEKTNVSTNVAAPKLVQAPTFPEDLKVSPALEEILKLAQAGVSDAVMQTYITNSTTFFNVTSDAIVYLNDLGVSNDIITALIQHDSTPEMQARKQMATAVQPLPSNIALTTPATNIYPPSVSQTAPVAPAPDTTGAPPPPAEQAAEVVSAPAEQPANVSYFYSSLAPYGSWVEVDGYGLCWQPTVVVSNPGWRPYRDRGRWLWSNHGWYWYSDYSWGWAPFHYGRWCDYPRLGWVWVPGTHWGPSWVSWRYSSSYCGWAPLPPECDYRSGFGFYYRGRSVGFGFDFGLGYHHYNYLPVNRFCDRSPGLHYLPAGRARAVHRETTVVNNYVVGNNNTIINNGVGRDRIAAANRGQVPTATVREATTRAGMRREQLVNNGSQLAVIRPALPAAPERSHVKTPTRAITRVSNGGSAPGVGRGGDRDASTATPIRPTAATAARRAERPNGVGRESGPVAVPRENGAPASSVRGGDRDSASIPGNRSPRLANPSPRNGAPDSTVARPSAPAVRSFARPGANASAGIPSRSDANNNSGNSAAPAPTTPAPEIRGMVRSPAPSANVPQPGVTRRATPSATRPTAPSSLQRNEPYRVYANPGANSRPAPAPSVQAPRSSPQVTAPARPSFAPPTTFSRPEPSRSAPSVSRSAPTFSRPEPSRSAPSFSAPPMSRATPSFSAPPSRPAPSFSAPPSRPSAPASSGGGGGRSQGRGRGE